MGILYSRPWSAPLLASVLMCATLGVAAPASALAPTNDTWDGRTIIAEPLPWSSGTVETNEATEANDDENALWANCFSSAAPNTTWYEFTPSATVLAYMDTTRSNMFAGVVVATGGPSSWSTQFCAFDRVGPVTFDGGVTYTLLAGFLNGGSDGQLVLDLEPVLPPSNDTIDGAIPVTEPLPWTWTGSNALATDDESEGDCGVGYYGKGIWFSFTPTVSRIGIDISRSVDPRLMIATGSPDALQTQGCWRDFPTAVELVPGTQYWLLLQTGAYAGNDITFSLSAAPLEFGTITIDRGTINGRGEVTLSGTYTCEAASASLYLSASVTQRQRGGIKVTGSRDAYLQSAECDGARQPWTVTVADPQRYFKAGPADVQVASRLSDPFGTVEWVGGQTLKLAKK